MFCDDDKFHRRRQRDMVIRFLKIVERVCVCVEVEEEEVLGVKSLSSRPLAAPST